jgi:hypothetical protein
VIAIVFKNPDFSRYLGSGEIRKIFVARPEIPFNFSGISEQKYFLYIIPGHTIPHAM